MTNNCYYHPNRPCVYVCNGCGRGLCQECAVNRGQFQYFCMEECRLRWAKKKSALALPLLLISSGVMVWLLSCVLLRDVKGVWIPGTTLLFSGDTVKLALWFALGGFILVLLFGAFLCVLVRYEGKISPSVSREKRELEKRRETGGTCEHALAGATEKPMEQGSVAARMASLRKLREEQLITQEEYDAKRSEILKDL